MFLWLPLLTNRAGTKSLFFDAALVMNGRNRVFRDCAEVLVQLFARTKGLYSFCLHMCNANVCATSRRASTHARSLRLIILEAFMARLDSALVAVDSKLADDPIVRHIFRIASDRERRVSNVAHGPSIA